ncbi:MAG: hypothetical protein ACI8W7_003731 [Gammaproteobacteria bacterium]|jgi:hypothetical protein
MGLVEKITQKDKSLAPAIVAQPLSLGTPRIGTYRDDGRVTTLPSSTYSCENSNVVGDCMSSDTLESLELTMVDSVGRTYREGLVADVAEVTLDALTSDAFISSIPIFGAVSKLYGGVVAIRDRLFLRKIHSFLVSVGDSTKEERDRFAAELAEDAGSRARAGEALLLLLERLDDLKKPDLVGRLYRAGLRQQINLVELRRFTSIIDKAFLPDLLALRGATPGTRLDGIIGHLGPPNQPLYVALPTCW